MPGKVPTRSPTHEEVEPSRIANIGVDLEDIAEPDGTLALAKVIVLAEDAGRPASHYVAAIPLATELRLAPAGHAVTAKICTGNCQRYGALDLVEHLLARANLQPVECLDQCDHGPAVELHGPGGKLVLAPATSTSIDEALGHLRQ